MTRILLKRLITKASLFSSKFPPKLTHKKVSQVSVLRTPLTLAIFVSLLAKPETGFTALAENFFVGSAKAFALGNAVTADPPGIDAIHFNPAGLVRVPDKGAMIELKSIAALGAEFAFKKSDHPDPYKGQTTLLNDCVNECLFHGEDPTKDEVLHIQNFETYVPFAGPVKAPVRENGTWIAAPFFPAFAYHPPGSNYAVGFSTYVTLAIGLTFSDQFNHQYGGIEHMSIGAFDLLQPAIGIQLNDHWTIGASVGIQTLGIAAGLNVRAPYPVIGAVNDLLKDLCKTDNTASAALCAKPNSPLSPYETLAHAELDASSNNALSMSFGTLWDPTPWLTWGLYYRAPTKHILKGKIDLDYGDTLRGVLQSNLARSITGLPPLGGNRETLDVSVPWQIPQQVSTGLSVLLTPSLRMNADYRWTQYSQWNSATARVTNHTRISNVGNLVTVPLLGRDLAAEGLTIPLGLKDTTDVALGLEYTLNQAVALRFGYEHRPSAMVTGKELLIAPIGDINLKNVGFAYKYSKNTVIDGAFGIIQSRLTVHYDSGNLLNSFYPGKDLTVYIKAPLLMLNLQTTW